MHLETICLKHEEEEKVHSPTNTEEEGYSSGDDKDMMMDIDSGNENNGGSKGTNGELKRPDLKGSFRCSICSKVFCHSSSLSRHRMQAHFKSYKCTVCRKDISSSESLRTHMFKQHHISRMYMCRCCNWAFPDKSLLHIHLQSANNNNNNLEVMPHSVINRSCHVIPDPFQLIRSPLLNLKTPSNIDCSIASLPVPTLPIPALQSPIAMQTPPQTPSWMATLPKPIPTTTPIFVAESPKKVKEEEKHDVYISQVPTCSFKSDQSAFHQLSSDRTLLASPLIDTASPSSSSSSSRISPRHDCFDCHINKTKLSLAETALKFLEAQMVSMRQENLEANAQMNGLEQTVLRLRMEAHVLREHNELFQRKLLECQTLSVKFLQSDKCHESSEVNAFLRLLINNTILSNSN
ncbi:CRE-ZTF-30 protein [Caenorhabditis remanei]|uniref:CRE-ZTF-30 protein n=1 Tax=Caenorhabditis remanei TaxID=31234 RepID=E3MNS8_CAERE|nr:CRE-ZTF-30 protein [Caenorhabditis remanei]